MPRHNPEKRAWRGRSYRKGGKRVRELKENMSNEIEPESKYTLVGGIPFRGYTGTGTYTGLRVVGTGTLKEIKKLAEEKYDDCGGLLIIIDNETGKEFNA